MGGKGGGNNGNVVIDLQEEEKEMKRKRKKMIGGMVAKVLSEKEGEGILVFNLRKEKYKLLCKITLKRDGWLHVARLLVKFSGVESR